MQETLLSTTDAPALAASQVDFRLMEATRDWRWLELDNAESQDHEALNEQDTAADGRNGATLTARLAWVI